MMSEVSEVTVKGAAKICLQQVPNGLNTVVINQKR